MPMTLISRTTLSGTAASVTFNSIPQTFQTLKLVVSARVSGAFSVGTLKYDFNGVTTNQSQRLVYGSGSTTTSASDTAQYAYVTAGNHTANTFSSASIEIPNYAGSANKVASVDSVDENNGTEAFDSLHASLWANTAAITSIALSSNGGNFVANSTFSLYGIS